MVVIFNVQGFMARKRRLKKGGGDLEAL